MSEDIPQRDALRLQLAMIAGNDPPNRRLELRWRNARGKMARQFFGLRELDRATSAILNVSQIGDTFIGAAPRVRDGGTARDVEHSWTLWADLDDAEALDRVNEFTPAPSIIITTGSGGGHAWWQLNRPLPGPWAKRANRRLATALGGDLAATDPARVLRPAGTRNYKHEPPRRACVSNSASTPPTRSSAVSPTIVHMSAWPPWCCPADRRAVPSTRSPESCEKPPKANATASSTGQVAAPANTSERERSTPKPRPQRSEMPRSLRGSLSWRSIARSSRASRRWRHDRLDC